MKQIKYLTLFTAITLALTSCVANKKFIEAQSRIQSLQNDSSMLAFKVSQLSLITGL